MNIGFENETIEFKGSISQLDKGIKGLTAMLNRSNRGTVYFGVRDDGEVIGLEIGPSTHEKIRNAIRDDVKPRLIVDIQDLESDDGKRYVSVSAYGYDVPYSYKDMYYIRHAASNEFASPEVVARIVLSKRYDSMKEMPSYRKDLKFDTFFDMLSSRGYHPRPEKGFLNSIGLLTREGEYNINASILADDNNILMQVVEFDGKDRTRFLKRTDFGNQCMFMAMRNVLDRIRSYNETRIDVSDGERKDEQLFDFECFREAWVNACVHNSWRTGVPPMVAIFEDRIEIDSVGGLPMNLRLADFYDGISWPVNESLFRISVMLGFTEHSGRGVPTIVERYGRDSISVEDQSVTVTIPFGFTPSSQKTGSMRIDADLTDNEMKLIKMVAGNENIRISDIADSMGISQSAVKRIIGSLKDKGILSNDGTNRKNIWVIHNV